MRRKEKEITELSEIETVIAEARVCRMALCDGDEPYVVPLSFGYADGTFYFHSALAGRKIEILGRNNRVCLELEAGVALKPGAKACEWGVGFRSVIGFGRAVLVEDPEARRRALDIIMGHYAQGPFEYSDAALAKTAVIRVDVERMTGKKSG
jgi:hypothetical protein